MLAVAPPAQGWHRGKEVLGTLVFARCRHNSAWSHRVDVCAAYYVVAEAFTIAAEHRHASSSSTLHHQ